MCLDEPSDELSVRPIFLFSLISYTDPQIHSKDSKGFGKGNLGVEGMLKFFQTHHCNAICRHLLLPPHQPKLANHGTAAASSAGRNPNPAQLFPLVRSEKERECVRV